MARKKQSYDNAAELAVVRLLDHIGEKSTRPGLLETPKRVVKALEFMTQGYFVDPTEVIKIFKDGACDEMVFQGKIPLVSLCEHHMLPFFGVAHIAYIPKNGIIGLSKFARVVDVFARRLQVQERLCTQVADTLVDCLSPDVGVVIQCRHLCMEIRGVQKVGSITTTTALRGSFKDIPHVKAEFLDMVRSVGSNAHGCG